MDDIDLCLSDLSWVTLVVTWVVMFTMQGVEIKALRVKTERRKISKPWAAALSISPETALPVVFLWFSFILSIECQDEETSPTSEVAKNWGSQVRVFLDPIWIPRP